MLKDGEKGVIIQRDRQTYGIAPHMPCGVVTPDMLRKIADVAERYDCKMLKLTSAARIAMLGIKEEDIDAIWADLGMDQGRVVGICVRSVKACPGTTFCKRGQQDSLGIGQLLDEKYHGMEMPGKMKMGISGCPNQCGENSFRDLGLMGTPKGWWVSVGGNGGTKARIAQVVAKNLSTDEALELFDRIIDYYRNNCKSKERIGKMIERLGLDHLQEALGLQ